MSINYTNPYRSITTPTIRLNLDASLDDVKVIRLVLLEQGGVQTAWALFLNHLANYVRFNNLTINDKERLVNHILSLCVTHSSGSTESRPDPTQTGGNDRRPTGTIRQKRSGKTHVPPISVGE